MDANRSVAKLLDGIIDNAIHLDLYIQYISLDTTLMRSLAQEITLEIDRDGSLGIEIESLSAYKDRPLKVVEVRGITARYLINQEDFIPLN